MANELKVLRIVKAAAHNDAQIQIAQGKNALLRYMPYVEAYAKASETERAELWSAAKEILNLARDEVVAYLKSKSDPNMPAEISDVRASEFRRIMKLGEYKCWRTVLGYFNDHALNFDDILAVVKYTTTAKPKSGERNGAPLPLDRPAPSKMQCLQAVKSRRSEKNKSNGESKPRAKDATKAFDIGKPTVEGFALWFKDHKAFRAKADKQLGIIKTAFAELQSIAREAAKA